MIIDAPQRDLSGFAHINTLKQPHMCQNFAGLQTIESPSGD